MTNPNYNTNNGPTLFYISRVQTSVCLTETTKYLSICAGTMVMILILLNNFFVAKTTDILFTMEQTEFWQQV